MYKKTSLFLSLLTSFQFLQCAEEAPQTASQIPQYIAAAFIGLVIGGIATHQYQTNDYKKNTHYVEEVLDAISKKYPVALSRTPDTITESIVGNFALDEDPGCGHFHFYNNAQSALADLKSLDLSTTPQDQRKALEAKVNAYTITLQHMITVFNRSEHLRKQYQLDEEKLYQNELRQAAIDHKRAQTILIQTETVNNKQIFDNVTAIKSLVQMLGVQLVALQTTTNQHHEDNGLYLGVIRKQLEHVNKSLEKVGQTVEQEASITRDTIHQTAVETAQSIHDYQTASQQRPPAMNPDYIPEQTAFYSSS